ncbi:hypothetical protein HDU86_002027 [Geranomyces michiganensis]|nr:hypothetical protein HDU86_002027 [Geranomyces michiganensis]
MTSASKAPAAAGAPLSLRTPFLLLLVGLSASFVYRHLKAGPYAPHLCQIFEYGCPDWPVSGHVAKGYEGVWEAFRGNFEDGEEVGASFFAWKDGKPVVQLTGGFFDTTYTTPYPEDALQLVFSSSKAVTGIAVATMVSKGHFSYEDRIADHWPEFAAGNKENVTIADLMGHRAGVTFLDPGRAPKAEDILDLDAFAETLAQQPHNFGGETRVGYHAVTRGWYINEIVRRTDPKKRTLGEYIREEIAGPLEIEYYLGLDKSLHHRVSPLVSYPPLHALFGVFAPTKWQKEPLPDSLVDALLKTDTVGHKALMASGPTAPWYEFWPKAFNRREIWSGESPSFSGITNARSLARLAAVMANNGVDPVSGNVLIKPDTIKKALTPLPVLMDQVMSKPLPFATGGWGIIKSLVYGQEWVGWAGAGGSMIWWNREEKLAFAYVMNAVKLQALGDKRSWRLIKAFLEGVDISSGRPVIDRVVGGPEPVQAAPPPV